MVERLNQPKNHSPHTPKSLLRKYTWPNPTDLVLWRLWPSNFMGSQPCQIWHIWVLGKRSSTTVSTPSWRTIKPLETVASGSSWTRSSFKGRKMEGNMMIYQPSTCTIKKHQICGSLLHIHGSWQEIPVSCCVVFHKVSRILQRVTFWGLENCCLGTIHAWNFFGKYCMFRVARR